MAIDQTVLDEVTAVVVRTLGIQDRAATLTASTALFGSMPELDSLAVLELVTAIEDRFGFTIDDGDITGEVFETIGTLVQFVEAATKPLPGTSKIVLVVMKGGLVEVDHCRGECVLWCEPVAKGESRLRIGGPARSEKCLTHVGSKHAEIFGRNVVELAAGSYGSVVERRGDRLRDREPGAFGRDARVLPRFVPRLGSVEVQRQTLEGPGVVVDDLVLE